MHFDDSRSKGSLDGVRLLLNIGRMVRGDRTERIGLRLNPEEAQVVSDLAAETGLTFSDVVRQAIRKAHPDRFSVAKPKAKSKK